MNLHSLSGGFTCIYRCTTVRLLNLIWKMRGCGKLMNNGMEILNPFDKKYNFLHLLFIFYLGVYMSMCMFLCVCAYVCVCACMCVCLWVWVYVRGQCETVTSLLPLIDCWYSTQIFRLALFCFSILPSMENIVRQT